MNLGLVPAAYVIPHPSTLHKPSTSDRRPYTCRFENHWAHIISGADEGVYGWIALNYATGHFSAGPSTSPSGEGTASRQQAIRLIGEGMLFEQLYRKG